MARRTLIHLAIAGGMSLLLGMSSPAAGIIDVPLLQPDWKDLSHQQREILAPLATEWDQLEPARRKKWIGIAGRYPSMTPDEKKHVRRNMQAWIKLTPTQRQQAREQYLKRKQNTSTHRDAVRKKWQEYNSLPDEEKNRLRQHALQKRIIKEDTEKGASRKSAVPATPSSPGMVPLPFPSHPVSPSKTVPTSPTSSP